MEETRIKPKKTLKERIEEDLKDTIRMWRGCLSGLVVGYVISYFFQSEFIRAKLGFGGYVEHIFSILFSFGSKMEAQAALTAWIFILIGAGVGGSIEKSLIKKGKIKAWTRKKQDEE